MSRLLFRLALLTVGLVAASCGQVRGPTEGRRVHLVIDAGSSGTRFCLFSIDVGASSSCKANPLEGETETCIKVVARGGLADLKDGERARVVRTGIALARARVGARLAGAVLLGTGGFRRLSPGASKIAEQSVARIVSAEFPGAAAHVISGEEEGRLAWNSVRIGAGAAQFTILETGGATIQLAGTGPEGVRALSFPLGQNAAFAQASRLPGFPACEAGAGKRVDAFVQCRGLVRALVGPIAVAAGTSWARPEPLFGLGSSWAALFSMQRTKTLTLAQIDVLGNRMCGLNLEEIVSTGIPRAFAARTCFLISLQRETLAATGHDTIRHSDESWPRGAAASGRYFRLCGP